MDRQTPVVRMPFNVPSHIPAIPGPARQDIARPTEQQGPGLAGGITQPPVAESQTVPTPPGVPFRDVHSSAVSQVHCAAPLQHCGPGGMVAGVSVTTLLTHESTAASILPLSPLTMHPPAASAFAIAWPNFVSAVVRQLASTATAFSSAFW